MDHTLTRWRKAHAIRQADLAAAAGCGQPTVSRLERRRPGVGNATLLALVAATERLAPGHGLTAGQILGLEPYEPATERPAARPADEQAA